MSDTLNVVWLGFLASLLAGLGTGVGAVGIFFMKGLSAKAEDMLLSAAAGIMLAAGMNSMKKCKLALLQGRIPTSRSSIG